MMFKNFKNKIIKNIEIFVLILLVLITASSASLFNYNKKNNFEIYSNLINNIYFKKTLNHIVKNLDPKYKKIKHKVQSGETFDKILEKYLIEKK